MTNHTQGFDRPDVLLRFECIGDGLHSVLTHRLCYFDSKLVAHPARADMVTDGISLPPWAWGSRMGSPYTMYLPCGLVHDQERQDARWFLARGMVERFKVEARKADLTFKEMLRYVDQQRANEKKWATKG